MTWAISSLLLGSSWIYYLSSGKHFSFPSRGETRLRRSSSRNGSQTRARDSLIPPYHHYLFRVHFLHSCTCTLRNSCPSDSGVYLLCTPPMPPLLCPEAHYLFVRPLRSQFCRGDGSNRKLQLKLRQPAALKEQQSERLFSCVLQGSLSMEMGPCGIFCGNKFHERSPAPNWRFHPV